MRQTAARWKRPSLGTGAMVAALLVAGCGGGDDGGGGNLQPQSAENAPGLGLGHRATVEATVLSSAPERVTGGDALIRLSASERAPGKKFKVSLNGVDVSDAFTPTADREALGIVSGLKLGENTLEVKHGPARTTLTLTNYPITGPVFSGPHERPYICATQNFTLPDGSKLGAPLDENCSVERRVHYVYRSTANSFKPLPTPVAAYPADVASTTNNAGATVPYIVRVETGTINRAIYQTAILHDPLKDAEPTPLAPPSGWNRKVIYPLGGGCQGGWYMQGTPVAVLNHNYLRKGYAVASASLNTFGNNCNDLLSSETIAMVKERLIENYGTPFFTIGTGGSGGAYQSHQTGDNYPGLFDGIIVTSVFPDVTSSTIFKLHDSRLLHLYFTQTAPGQYSDAQRSAISGYLKPGNIAAMSSSAGRLDPVVSFPAGFPADQKYHPVNNPTGVRATVYDHTVNVYGKDARGFAKRPIDNVGVQYGLKALNDGMITPDQFIDLNEKIGGVDVDFKKIAQRTVGDLDAIARAYQSGRITSTGGGLATTPIIDQRDYYDDRVNGDIHNKIHSYSVRARLIAANGHADNQVIVGPGTIRDDNFDQMDRWLTAMLRDTGPGSKAEKVVRNKPADLVDACWDAGGNKIIEPQTAHGPGQCNTLYPAGTTPRMVAGGPLADDIVKCQLKPVDPADYKVMMTPAQLARLQSIFTTGVCDWSRPGVEQQPLKGTWLSFGPSPVNLLFDVTQP
ncbi:DUF6351 family protein [Cupriavidus cauae]|uniref:DUF6351 family protein n=2 Tax=Cupriavidus TaxID=106589 RepID=UPI002242D92E|nr:DUF6351 family protein [Cupriavidus cauae]